MLLVLVIVETVHVSIASQVTGEWALMENAAGSNSCAARLTGSEVDTMLMLNQNGELLLVAGKAAWRAAGSQGIALRIDDVEFDHLTASAFNNLVLLPISDDAMLRRLQSAKDLYWYLPSGKYHAAVAGLGEALEWLHTCEHGKHLGVSSER
jgi:hypothetical protein